MFERQKKISADVYLSGCKRCILDISVISAILGYYTKTSNPKLIVIYVNKLSLRVEFHS